MMTTVTELILHAAALLGGETKLAKACGISQNAIWQAKTRGRISPELAIGIHWATDQRVPANELRPDLWMDPSHVPLPTRKLNHDRVEGVAEKVALLTSRGAA
jgi:DNA-binding transcriptional regulator YdaS (Cro superfamily)